jgi:hypothetical protein
MKILKRDRGITGDMGIKNTRYIQESLLKIPLSPFISPISLPLLTPRHFASSARSAVNLPSLTGQAEPPAEML